MSPENLEAEAEWEIWYQDTFDRESPRQVEVAGRELVEGLIQLWARHLYETVQPDGQRGFSRFNLWWKQEKKSIKIVGAWEGQVRLREWVYGDKRETNRGYMAEGDRTLLYRVAAAHQAYILRGETSEKILAAAEASRNREDFEEQLSHLA